jgi:hypothetical protein
MLAPRERNMLYEPWLKHDIHLAYKVLFTLVVTQEGHSGIVRVFVSHLTTVLNKVNATP